MFAVIWATHRESTNDVNKETVIRGSIQCRPVTFLKVAPILPRHSTCRSIDLLSSIIRDCHPGYTVTCNRVRRQSGFPTFISCQRQDANVLPKRRQSHQGDKLCDVSTVPLVARWPVFLAADLTRTANPTDTRSGDQCYIYTTTGNNAVKGPVLYYPPTNTLNRVIYTRTQYATPRVPQSNFVPYTRLSKHLTELAISGEEG